MLAICNTPFGYATPPGEWTNSWSELHGNMSRGNQDGSILGSLRTHHELWMSKVEYEEHGPALIHRKGMRCV